MFEDRNSGAKFYVDCNQCSLGPLCPSLQAALQSCELPACSLKYRSSFRNSIFLPSFLFLSFLLSFGYSFFCFVISKCPNKFKQKIRLQQQWWTFLFLIFLQYLWEKCSCIPLKIIRESGIFKQTICSLWQNAGNIFQFREASFHSWIENWMLFSVKTKSFTSFPITNRNKNTFW